MPAVTSATMNARISASAALERTALGVTTVRVDVSVSVIVGVIVGDRRIVDARAGSYARPEILATSCTS